MSSHESDSSSRDEIKKEKVDEEYEEGQQGIRMIRAAIHHMALVNNDDDDSDHREPYRTPTRFPGVEWINGDESVHQRSDEDFPNESSNRNNISHVVDSSAVSVVLTLEGRVVGNKTKFTNFIGIGFAFALVTVLTIIIVLFTKDSKIVLANNETDSSPTSTVNPLIVEIVAVSGIPTFEVDSPQHKALWWILREDEMKLTHKSTNLFQRYALMVFFYSLSGDNWSQRTGFGTGIHECEWFGINCATSGNVTAILLELNMLNGKIPPEISLFPHLRRLDLSGNSISGSIPPNIGDLKKLFMLDMDSNRLTSTIPSTLANCGNLRFVNLAFNRLDGSFPMFFSFRALQWLNLSDNFFSGDISSEVSKYQSLVELNVSGNNFSGKIPTEISSISSIETLDLSKNKFSGSIPFTIGNLTLMKVLSVTNNGLYGTIPQSATRLSKLITLDTSKNSFSGTIPDSISNLTSLQVIDFSHNVMNGTIPLSITQLPELNILKLHHNNFTGTVTNSMCDKKLMILTTDCADPSVGVLCNCCSLCY